MKLRRYRIKKPWALPKQDRGQTLGVAQTHLLFEKSKAKTLLKPHKYAVLDG
ncbi:MAG: hypothetical protein AB7E42_01935 [Anaerotignaceae bacterium]